MKPILCVVDLAETSVHALEVAAKMAYAYRAHVIILFPYRLIDNDYKGEISKLKLTLEQEAKQRFLSFAKQISFLDQVSYEFQPEIGFCYDRISSYARRNKIGSVVISQHQANAMNEVNPMTLQHLITHSKLPFTIVPGDINVKVIANLEQPI